MPTYLIINASVISILLSSSAVKWKNAKIHNPLELTMNILP